MLVITDDRYLASGFAGLITDKVNQKKNSMALIDDGFRYFYLISVESYNPVNADIGYDPISYFLNHMIQTVPRRITSENIESVESETYQRMNKVIRLSRSEMAVVKDIVRGISPVVSQTVQRLTYKAWYNRKNAAFKRLGIKSPLSLVRAVNVWKARGHKMMCEQKCQ